MTTINNLSNLYEKANAFERLSIDFSSKNRHLDAINYYMDALKLYEELSDNIKIGSVSLSIAYLYTMSGNFDKAYIFYKKALFLYKELDSKANISYSLLGLGVMNRKKLDYAASIFYLSEAKKFAEENNIKEVLAEIYDNLGKTYRKTQKYTDALELHRLSLDILNIYPNQKTLISNFCNIGSCYFDTKDNLNALSYFESALSLAQDDHMYTEKSTILKKISLVYIAEKDYDMALFFLKNALELYSSQQNERGLCSCYLDLGYVYKMQSDFNLAQSFLEKALDFSIKLNIQDYILLCYKYLSEVFELSEDYKLALEYYKTYTELKDSIFNEKNNEYLAKIYSQYQMENKEKENEIYRLKNIELVNAHDKLQEAYDKLEYIATRDPLTGLLNRRALMERIDLEKNRCRRNKSPMSIILSDIDNFKVVNDTYGHDVGDEILVCISKLLTRTLRDVDYVCRWGGEEFLILLPDTNCEQACHVAEKIRKNIQSYDFNKSLKKGSVTMTLGVAEFSKKQTIKQWIKIADAALYTGKNLGRNRVVQESSYVVASH